MPEKVDCQATAEHSHEPYRQRPLAAEIVDGPRQRVLPLWVAKGIALPDRKASNRGERADDPINVHRGDGCGAAGVLRACSAASSFCTRATRSLTPAFMSSSDTRPRSNIECAPLMALAR